jgi:hypothetical protein
LFLVPGAERQAGFLEDPYGGAIIEIEFTPPITVLVAAAQQRRKRKA